MAETLKICATHPYVSDASSVLDMSGSIGNSAIRRPSLVSSPRSFKAASAYSCSSARSRASAGGASMKSKCRRSLMASDLSMSTTLPMFVRWISGTVFSSSSCRNDHRV